MDGRDPRGRAASRRPLKVKMISPAKTAADSVYWRSIKYSLFPPLGLATLAGYLGEDDEVTLQDEHVEKLDLSDEPDLVVIEAYITSARRAYRYADHYRAKGAYVCLGGLHPTSLPEEAAQHADSVFRGPGEDTWPAFLADFRAGHPKPLYHSTVRTLAGMPRPRRDLIKRERYLVPNSLVVSRGCPHRCDFCYKETFFRGGRSFYVQAVEDALAEIDRLPRRHLYFLDDNLFGSPPFAAALCDGLRGMGRLWQSAGTVQGVMRPGLLEKAVESGLRSLFIGFETLDPVNLRAQHKTQNLGGAAEGATARAAAGGAPQAEYEAAIRRLHDLGVMVNAAFVFGMDHDDSSVFARTVEWTLAQGIETSTFHILTPYPGTPLERRLTADGRVTSRDWDLYDTRHAVFRPAGMSAEELESGYWAAYRDFYRWSSIWKAAFAHGDLREHARHLAYTGGWKKLEPMWDLAIRGGKVHAFVPLLETILDRFGSGGGAMPGRLRPPARASLSPSCGGVRTAGGKAHAESRPKAPRTCAAPRRPDRVGSLPLPSHPEET